MDYAEVRTDACAEELARLMKRRQIWQLPKTKRQDNEGLIVVLRE